jgi:hypothetical protein
VFWSAFAPEKDGSLYDEVPPDYQRLFAQLADASAETRSRCPCRWGGWDPELAG